MQKIILVISLCIFLCSCNADTAEIKQQQQQNNVIQEYNRLGVLLYDQVDKAQATGLTSMDCIMDLCLYNCVDADLSQLFIKEQAHLTTDAEAQNEELYKTFWELKCAGTEIDAYDVYLDAYARRKGVLLEDVYTRVKAWEKMSREQQDELVGTEEDYSDFFAYESTIKHHDYYVRVGTDSVNEIIVITGKYAEQMVVIITWQDGKIIDLVRMFTN